jgi:hypothetical protein
MDFPEPLSVSEKLQPLLKHFRPGTGACPFVVDRAAERLVRLTHYAAGEDVKYVSVWRTVIGNQPPDPLEVAIHFAPFVEGTALIYDVTAESMQGKARPFTCRFDTNSVRLYAMLPFQIEDARIKVAADSEARLEVAFLDGRGEVIRGALPLEIYRPAYDRATRKHSSTDPGGRCVIPLDNASSSSATGFVIRSLLTGLEYAASAR